MGAGSRHAGHCRSSVGFSPYPTEAQGMKVLTEGPTMAVCPRLLMLLVLLLKENNNNGLNCQKPRQCPLMVWPCVADTGEAPN